MPKKRIFDDWIEAYCSYAGITESPTKMHTWTAISTIASVLRRKVWIDMIRYKWYPSFYIILVAPPGVVAKSTTVDIGTKLLQQVPGIHFGPDIITWQALVQAFAQCGEQFEYAGEFHPMSAMTLVASELGNLINPQDREMLNVYIQLYDGLSRMTKQTKTSGNDTIEAPWLNMIGCTTPHWVADNMPLAAIGGGFTSRCIFVYAEKKEKYIPYVDEMISIDLDAHTRTLLIADLVEMSQLTGKFTITPKAREWARNWYQSFWDYAYQSFSGRFLEGYAGRKYTHLHKTAMILSVAKRNDLVIDVAEIQLAHELLEAVEPDMEKVFSQIGRTPESNNAETFLNVIKQEGSIPLSVAYRKVFSLFPSNTNFDAILLGLTRSNQIMFYTENGETVLKYIGG